jgi:autoinducer 2-degrading protein
MAYAVCVTWIAKDGEEEAVAAAIERLLGPSRAEPGVQLYLPHRNPKDSRVFFMYEQYTDEAAYQAHVDTEHFKRDGLGDAIPRLAERRREFYETLD